MRCSFMITATMGGPVIPASIQRSKIDILSWRSLPMSRLFSLSSFDNSSVRLLLEAVSSTCSLQMMSKSQVGKTNREHTSALRARDLYSASDCVTSMSCVSYSRTACRSS